MSEPASTITLLGLVAIDSYGANRGVATRGRRAELVFAYLAAEHRRLVTQDELADALWPEGLPNTWEAALRGVLTEVRRFLSDNGLDPGDVLTTARRGYQLRLPATVTVDLDVARDALASARAHLASGSAKSAADAAARAASLAGLPFLPNHDGEWVDGIRRELTTINARALELEARAHASGGDLAAAANAAERLVSAEPYNETAHQLRIRILGQAGDRSGAIKAYEHCRQVLADELGVDPSDETTAAYREATEADPAATKRAAAPTAEGELANLTMMVVEDHDFQRRTAMMLLRNLGVGHVSEAADGAAALKLLEGSSPPDVILCDLDMPGMDGVEFIRHVAQRELAGAVIIASALEAKVVRAVRSVSEGYGLQVLGAIEKPLTARVLGELLAAYRPRPTARSSALSTESALSVSASDAKRALAEGWITFHLQPAVDVATGEIAAADAVPRWYQPDNASVPPTVFLPLFAREGLLGALSERGLELACAQIPALANEGLDVAITVGLASQSLHDTDLADRAVRVAAAAGADTARITFELDERAFRSEPALALSVLTRLRVKGFGVALGSFGGANAPVELLRGLPLTEVRLDPVLVSGAAADPRRARALEDSIGVGRDLGVRVVGAGCETDHDLRLLLSLGCDRVLGTFIAAAMPGEHFADWVAGWDPNRLGVGQHE